MMELPESTVYLGLGSNTGNSAEFLAGALKMLAALPETRLLAVSPVYESAPMGGKASGTFYNMAAAFETTIPPEELLSAVKKIELNIGRIARWRWSDREIDIDILLHGTSVINSGTLTIPHNELQNRDFVLTPLLALNPLLVHPATGIPLKVYQDKLPERFILGVSKSFNILFNNNEVEIIHE